MYHDSWRTSIRRKLMAIIMLSVGIALFSVGIVFFTVQLISTRRVTSARLDSTARIIGTNSAGALSFNDRAIAEKTLEALAAEPEVQAAQLFDRDGKPFARYVRSRSTSPLPANPGPDGVRLEASQLVLFRPIVLDNERIGTIFLLSGLEGQNSLLRLFASLALGVTGLALILALGISTRLQRVVSEPILHLTNLTRQVSERKDYSLRADIRNQDELGQLASGLNEMLTRIQTHEAELRKLNRRLRLQSGCNQTIVRAHDENSLLTEMCQFLLDVGGYPLVWIDYCDPAGAEAPHRMAQAWKGGNPPPADSLREPDYPSSVAIPLVSLDQPLGELSVYADLPGAFDAEEVGLLTELASDLVYGIVTLRAREQRTKAENELKNTQLFLANVIESMPSMLISVRPDGSITQWNETATRATGIPASRAIGQNLWTLLPPFAKFRTHVTRMIETRRIMEFYKEVMQLEAEKKFFNVSLFPLVTTQFTGVVIRADDVTEIERKEHQLRQSQKMETVGTLAGGLAHDFNNVLGGIIGTLSLLQFKQNSPGGVPQEELRKSITLIETAANRAAEMVQHLLALSRKQELTFVPVDLNLTIGHVIDICRNTLDKSVELVPLPASTPAMVNSDPTQMEQVLLNLCVNAAHAMTIMKREGQPWGGKLTVSLNRAFADQPFCHSHPEATAGKSYWLLSVRDEGVGIESSLLGKVFDPFFTTKSQAKGTGLGLAMVYHIVHQHQGFIDVYSEIGAGSTFRVYLPALEEPEGEPSRENHDDRLPRGQGLVLVVDDEPLLRQISREMLETCGYEVILAENGQEGVDLYRERHTEIALVLLDMNMPKKSGLETCREMKGIDPHVKVVMASGFRNDERMEEVLALGVADFIQKPYSMKELVRVIHDAMLR